MRALLDVLKSFAVGVVVVSLLVGCVVGLLHAVSTSVGRSVFSWSAGSILLTGFGYACRRVWKVLR